MFVLPLRVLEGGLVRDGDALLLLLTFRAASVKTGKEVGQWVNF